VQLALEGISYHKPKHTVGQDIIGADLGPSTIALVPREGEASLSVFCEELVPDDMAIGNTIILEKISYRAWQKQYGKSVGMRAPGMFVEHLKRIVARTGGTLIAVIPRQAKLSQFCHGCGRHVKKPLSQRWHVCSCGIGPVQRDLYSAFLASTLDPDHLIPSCAQAVVHWEASETRLRAAHERVQQRANEGHSLPRSMGWARAGARRPSSLSEPTQEPALRLRHGRLEAWKDRSEPLLLELGESSGK